MLPEKAWKTDAILRLVAGVLICGFFMGTLAISAVDYLREPQGAHRVLLPSAAAGAFGAFGVALFFLGRPWGSGNFTRNFTVLVACVYAGLALTWWTMHLRGGDAGIGKSAANVVIAVLSFQGAALLLVYRFTREHHVGWTEAFGLKIGWRRALLLGVVAALVFLPVGWGLQWASVSAMERFHLHPQDQGMVEILRASEGLPNRFVLGVAAILIAPLGEELLFRGILYPAIKQRGFPRLALWGTSLAFGAIHLNLAIFLPLTVLALLLAWLYEKTENLLAPAMAHSCFNAINFLWLYALPLLETNLDWLHHKPAPW
jgi:membrane protease YdiL (CAAX protease family)